MNNIQISKINDSDVREIKQYYWQENHKNFVNEYRISDSEFCKLFDENKKNEHKKVYDILTEKKKRIFDIFNIEDIIVTYKDEDIDLLYEILQDNQIKCHRNDFVSYLWVRFDNKNVLEFANFGPINHNSPTYSFDNFINLINKN